MTEASKVKANLSSKIHWNIHIEGPDADQVNLIDLIKQNCKTYEITVTSASSQTYYNTNKSES